MSETYTYAVLRYFHDIAAGECLNVGVALFAPKSGFLGVRCTETADRAALLFPDLNKDAFQEALRAIEIGFVPLQRRISKSVSDQISISELVRAVLPSDDSSLKWGSFGSGITDDPPLELHGLFSRMVQRYEAWTMQVAKLAELFAGDPAILPLPMVGQGKIPSLASSAYTTPGISVASGYLQLPNLAAPNLLCSGTVAIFTDTPPQVVTHETFRGPMRLSSSLGAITGFGLSPPAVTVQPMNVDVRGRKP